MLKLTLFAACVVAVLAAPSARDESLIVQTTGGLIQGEDLSAGLLDGHYYSFRGIPYAVPPVGELRFRAPLPHPGWEGVREGFEHGLSCASGIQGNGPGVEDCLFLNVYTPSFDGSRPVMFWIHGGSFSGGSGDSFVYGPEHLIPEDVLVVTINYRLGVAGFLSTGDNEATGNYGMKDAILALKWVRDNIAAFGGDPDNVTIFGESAGGAAVHYLVLSPQAAGLFSKAISQSGSALNPWAYQTDPLTVAKTLAESLEIEFTTTAELVEALREVPYELFSEHIPGMMSYPYIRGLTPIPFVPSRDPAGVSAEEAFLPDEPINILTAGTFNHVPYISGYVSDESLFMIRELLLDAGVFDIINADPHLFVPQNWGIAAGSDASNDIIQQVKDMYFNGTELLVDYRYLYTQYCSDLMFLWGIDRTVRLHAERQAHPVYYYRFSFDGALNLIKTGLFLSEYPGAVHADELFYLFSVTRFPPPLLPTNPAVTTRRRMVRMWANFAKTGNPTPQTDAVVNQLWTPVQGTQEFMDIDTNLIPGRFPNAARMQMWDALLRTYAPSH